MKKIKLPLFLLLALISVASFQADVDEVKITGNTLLSKIQSLDQTQCSDLSQMRVYILAYQQLRSQHKEELKDNSKVLTSVNHKISKGKCELSELLIPEGYTLENKITISGGGGNGSLKGKTVSPSILAAMYMDVGAREAFLSRLPEKMRVDYFQFQEDLKKEDRKEYEDIMSEINEIKALDNKNYVNWYFQNADQSVFKTMEPANIEDLKLDLKIKADEFKHQ